MIFKIIVLIAVTAIILKEVACKGRSKKSKSLKVQNYAHQDDIYTSLYLPSDVQITTYLYKGYPKTFYYWSSVNGKSLSAIVMTCSSSIEWTMFYHYNGNVTIMSDTRFNYTDSTKDIGIKNFKSLEGQYIFQVISKESNTFLHIYISTENDGPQALRSAMQNNLRILKRGRKDWLTIRWEPSLVDPQRTDYCLVINTKNHYKTICSAELAAPQNDPAVWELKSGFTKSLDHNHPTIQCVGRKTHLKTKVKSGLPYYFDLFAINKQSNLSYLLDTAYKKIDYKSKFIPIKDGKFASLKKMEGKATFRFKVGRRSGPTLSFYIIPCGSFVFVDIRLKKKTLLPQTRVDRFKNITIPNITKGQRYIIRVLAPQDDFVTTGIEIYATTKPSRKSPIPTMPQNTTVKEYETMRTCNSVTLGWMPILGQPSATYCFIVKEGKIKENEGYSQPNQCGLENRLRKSLDFTLSFCKNIDHKNQDVITKEIKRLKPGKSYLILVSVSHPKGRSLSYNVLQVNTLSYCNSHRNSE